MRKMKIAAAALVPVALFTAACGGSPTAQGTGGGESEEAKAASDRAAAVYDEINGLSGDERTARLVELAEEEGALSVYTSNSDMDDLVDTFEDAYDIDVAVYRGNSESVLQRVLQEQQAGFRGVDIVETNALELNVLQQEEVLYPYEGELRDAVREEGQADGWTATRFNVFVVGWNTNKVAAGSEPESLEDLAEPEWKGMVSMEVGDVDWFTTMYQYYLEQGKSEEEVEDLFRRLAANSKVVKGHTVQAELLAAGQYSVGASLYSHSTDGGQADGAPITWRPEGRDPVQPLVIRPNGGGLVKNAEHPAAAMLFMDHMLTEGQELLAEDFRIGSIPTADDPLAGLEVLPVPEQLLMEDSAKWDNLYAELLRGGQEIAD